jgi:hypothetical protein
VKHRRIARVPDQTFFAVHDHLPDADAIPHTSPARRDRADF